jgi:hypothetical protein
MLYPALLVKPFRYHGSMEAQVVFNLGLATGFFLGLAASAFLTQATLHLSEVFSHLVDRLLSSFRRRIGS